MGRGFLSGIFWGCIVGVAVIFVSSQAMDRQQLSFPQPEAAAVEVPGGSEFDQARAETDPVMPEPESAPGAEEASGIALPEDSIDTPPVMDTAALEVPVPQPVEDVPGLGDAPAGETEAPEPVVTEDTAVAPATGEALTAPEAPGAAPETVEAPEAPATEPESEPAPDVVVEEEAPVAETEIAALPATDTEADAPETGAAPGIVRQEEAPSGMTAPEIATEPSLPPAGVVAETPAEPDLPQIAAREPEPEPEPQPVPEPQPEPQPEPETAAPPAAPEPEVAEGQDAQDTEVAAAEPEEDGPSLLKPVEDLTEADNVETGRLPQAGDDDDGNLPTILRVGEDEEDAPDAAATDEEEAAPADGPALQVNASEFDNPDALPLVSIVLVHSGGTMLDGAKLLSLPPNVSFAIDASRDDAAELARAYRAAGREVVMIPSLPTDAGSDEVRQALQANMKSVPQAVAWMDVSGSFQSDRTAVAEIVAAAAETGHGLITYPRGLNAAHQEAGRAGIPAGLIFRDIDGDGETQEQIGRALDRAAFRARQDEAVILVGTTADPTLAAIVEWSLGNRAESVAIAPVSAALAGG